MKELGQMSGIREFRETKTSVSSLMVVKDTVEEEVNVFNGMAKETCINERMKVETMLECKRK